MKPSLDPRKLANLRGVRPWVAIVFGEGGLEATVARGSAGTAVVVRETSAEIPVGGESGEVDVKSQWRAAAESLRRQIDPAEHRVVTAIGTGDVLCQVLSLPATNPAEVKQMLHLQIDRLTPLPLEEVVYDYEPLEVSASQTRVLVAIARKDAVNERVETLETAGLPPEVVSVDALAVFRELIKREVLPRDEKINALVGLSPAMASIIVYSSGAPMVIRSILLGSEYLGSPEGQSALREELERTLVAAQIERSQLEHGRVTFLTRVDELRSTAEQVGAAWTTPVEILSNGAAPSTAVSLGLQSAAASAHGAVAGLNLLPDEWRQRRRAARTKRRLITCGIAIAIVYVLALATFFSFVAARGAKKARLDAQIKALTPQYDEAKQLREQLLAMQRQLDTKTSALEAMREVSTLMPDNLKLSKFQFRKDPTETTLTLQGQAQSASLAIDFSGRLKQSPLFSKIAPGAVRSDPGSGLTRFEIVCTLKPTVEGTQVAHGTE